MASLFSKVDVSDPQTYAAGQDGGSLKELAAAIARGEVVTEEQAEKWSPKQGKSPKLPPATFEPPPPSMDYRFTGLSIWLEVDEDEAKPVQRLIDKYQTLGSEPSFPVHATVLYSMDPALLRAGDPEFLTEKLAAVVDSLPTRLIFLKPKKLVYFPYPKSADNGKGFGCLMPFFLINMSQPLVHLFEACKNSFPPDERHGGRDAGVRRVKSEASLLDLLNRQEDEEVEAAPKWTTKRKGFLEPREKVPTKEFTPLRRRGRVRSFHSLTSGKAYTPHLSIAYLSMSRTDIMNERVCEEIVRDDPDTMKTVKAKWLSAWWTEGKVEDWKRICRV
eukprot:CAMPEP_0182455116 /NCGR_PEP_ID=MMETSP1319-20130603/1430_1 /TAXON_ID=172717 /ORGANISM="Bolidomonas pacifica, Strain RCC208" /LENGTH=331 /DNA_ID=CAMNT_0024653151 /DNA_START=139 /DNA_END=1131 /DNA_ORIENTATION=-